MPFDFTQKVLFKHCDPAGIVFYPRYFEMMNDCVEAFFDEVLGVPFQELLIEHGVPTVSIATTFMAPSHHGDTLNLALAIEQVGRTSVSYRLTATCQGGLRFESRATLVQVDTAGRPAPWPDCLRKELLTQKDLVQ